MKDAEEAWSGVRVLVTGGAGFIGSNLVDGLVGAGARVSVLDNLATGFDRNLEVSGEHIEFHLGDVRDQRAVAAAIGEDGHSVDVILHLGALGSVPRSFADPLECHEVNVTGTLYLLVRAAEISQRRRMAGRPGIRFVLASSSSVYGGGDGEQPTPESRPPAPRSPYAASKVAAEAYVRAFHERGGLETSILRLFNVYGPRQDPGSQYAAVVPLFLAACRAGRSPVIHGDGLQRRDFTYVDDVVRAFMHAGRLAGASGATCNIGGSRPHSILELASMIIKVTVQRGVVEPTHAEPREGDVRYSCAAVERARQCLGWEAAVTLEEGLRLTAAAQGGSGIA